MIRSHYRMGFLKQYVRDRFILRKETATTNTSTDYGIGKAVENLPELRQRLGGIVNRYLDVQQDILETFVDREELRQLTQPTVLRNGRHIPGLKLDHPRQLALMHSLVRFCYSDLLGVPEALRKDLRATDGWHPAALCRGPVLSKRKDHGSRSSIYRCDSSAGRSGRDSRFESSLKTQALRERNPRLGPYKRLTPARL